MKKATQISVGSFEAKTHLPRLLVKVAKGAEVTITKHGVPIATLVSAQPQRLRSVKDVIESIQTFQRGKTLHSLSLRKLIEIGKK